MNSAFSRNTPPALRAGAVLALVFCAAFVMPAIFAAAACCSRNSASVSVAASASDAGVWLSGFLLLGALLDVVAELDTLYPA